MRVSAAWMIVMGLPVISSAASTVAAPPAPAAAPAAAAVARASSPAPAVSGEVLGCADRSSLATGKDTPPPFMAAAQLCGTCSTRQCSGALVGQYCGLQKNGLIAECLPPLGWNCSDGVTWQCQCWSGPLP